MSEYNQIVKNIWFPRQKQPFYDPSDEESLKAFYDYWKLEKERCIHGFYLADGRVFVSGWLYFHTVYWSIAAYIENPRTKKKARKIITPLLRDIEWDIAGDFIRCESEGRFYNLVGSRDFGKSIIAASRAGWQYTFFDNSESVISAGAYDYIKLATDKIEDGLLNIHPIFKKQRLKSDWKSEVRAGWKDKKTNLPHEKSSHSRILVRNYENGTKTMAANGTRPGFHLIDEEGTIPNLIGCIKDSDGCWWSGDGDKPSCLTMVTGTGGDMEVGEEAAEIFYKPYAYNMLEFENEWEGGGKIGRFIPATRAKLAFKEPKRLSEYIGINHPDLDVVEILVSNEERAKREWWDKEYAKAKSSGNSKAILKFKAYWPLIPSDSFLRLTHNDFPVEAAKYQQTRIRNLGLTGTPIELIHNGEKIIHKFSDKLPITEFPCKTQDKDAPIMIYEFPPENPPYGLYVAGIDPYRTNETKYGDSLGAVYIFKLIHDIQSEKFQFMFVASYVARPRSIETWQENARNLLKYYNAQGLCENDEMSFINYMIYKGDGHYLVDQPGWLKEIVPNTKVDRPKGIHRSSDKIRDYLHGIFKKYMTDIIHIEKDDNGSILKEVLGVSRILDPMLLEEVVRFDSEEGNYDRVVAAELALALAEHMGVQVRVGSLSNDARLKSLYSNSRKAGAFDYKEPVRTRHNKNKLGKHFI